MKEIHYTNEQNTPQADRRYKDTVFRMLFSDKENLLSLYNALNGTSYDDPEMLEIVTLENAIYMEMKNDIAFIVGTDLHLFEHQSTRNPNMPLRFLHYVSREYEKLVDSRKLYLETPVSIPAPCFIVFYNGEKPMPERSVMKLSDLYTTNTYEPAMDLRVIVYNVNNGYNIDMMNMCRTLSEYAEFVAIVRGYLNENEINKAVSLAVDECIERGILEDFLLKNKSEVIAVSIFEFDRAGYEELLKEESRSLGVQEGIEIGTQQSREKIAKKLRSLGMSDDEINTFLEDV